MPRSPWSWRAWPERLNGQEALMLMKNGNSPNAMMLGGSLFIGTEGCKVAPVTPRLGTAKGSSAAGPGIVRPRPIGNPALRNEQSDLRSLVCEWDVLRDRIARGVCFLDPRVMASPGIEVPVGLEMSLPEVFRRADIGRATRTQVRLITKDSIIQTPFLKDSKGSPFWSLSVHPGDIIVLPPQQF